MMMHIHVDPHVCTVALAMLVTKICQEAQVCFCLLSIDLRTLGIFSSLSLNPFPSHILSHRVYHSVTTGKDTAGDEGENADVK